MGVNCSNCVSSKDAEMVLSHENNNTSFFLHKPREENDTLENNKDFIDKVVRCQAFARMLLSQGYFKKVKAIHFKKNEDNLNDSLNDIQQKSSKQNSKKNSFKQTHSYKNSYNDITESVKDIEAHQIPEPPQNNEQNEVNMTEFKNNEDAEKLSQKSLSIEKKSSSKNLENINNDENINFEENQIYIPIPIQIHNNNKESSQNIENENTFLPSEMNKTKEEIIQEYLRKKSSQFDITNENLIYIENTFNNRQDTMGSFYNSSNYIYPQLLSENNLLTNQQFNLQNPFSIAPQNEIYIEPSLNDIDMNDTKSLDLVNYNQDRLAQLSCESFFIRNSYENKTPYTNINNTLINNININDESMNSNYYADDIRESNESKSQSPNNKIRRVIKTVVRRIIKTPTSGALKNKEFINNEIKKAIIILTLLSKKDNKLKLLHSKNFFRIWKEKAKENINRIRHSKIHKMNSIKNKSLGRIMSKKSKNTIQGSFYQWYTSSVKIGSRIALAKNILRKLFIFREKCNVEVYFRDWKNKVSALNKKEDLYKLKESLFGKIFNNFINKKLCEIISKRFGKWKNLMQNVEVKNKMMFTLGSIKLSKILKKIVEKNIFEILFTENEKNKISNKKSDALLIYYNRRHNNEIKTEKKKFLTWFYNTCPEEMKSPRKMNVISGLIQIYNTADNLRSIIEKVISRKFLRNLKRKADWERPIHKIYPVKTKYVKYFLLNGQVKTVKKENILNNILWKYCKPVKYYFLKYKLQCNRKELKDLEIVSRKWQIEEKFEDKAEI